MPSPIKAGFLALVLSLLLMAGSGCRARVDYFPDGNVQTGTASWYGDEFHGRATSSKEVYDMNDLTAAHNTLPLGTTAVVTNLNNGKSVTVRINDRGPFVKGRVIDLSYAAARAIDLIGPGTAPVRIEVLRKKSPPQSVLRYSVQVGSFVSRQNAEGLQKTLAARFSGISISTFKTASQTYYRVRLKARSREEAEEVARRLAAAGQVAIIFEEQ
jgi:rare lipoprotein A